MYLKKQQGKGLFNFMAGSIVALAAIAGVLFLLDKNSSRDFKQPQLAEQKNAPEVLSPQASMVVNNAPVVEQTPMPAPIEQQPAPVAPAPAPVIETVHEPVVQAASEVRKPVTVAEKPRREVAQSPAKPRPAETAKSTNYDPVLGDEDSATVSNPEEVRPTAEQILDSGSIQKAREVAQREARERRARQAAQEKARQAKAAANEKPAAPKVAENKPADSKSTTPERSKNTASTSKPAASSKTNTAANKPASESKQPATAGRSSVQAGAYANRQAADEQRAKLARMGVQTKVVPVQSNGKTMYRVQTSQMDSEQANQIKQRLQSKGVESITRH